MSWGPEAGARYERWRRQWLAGSDSQALARCRWHGLAAALALTAPRAAPARAGRVPEAPARGAGTPDALGEAARLIRALLRPRTEDSHA